MKQIGVLTAAVTGGVVLVLASCGRAPDATVQKAQPLIAAPARTIAAVPHQHAVTRDEELLANDLEHGAGAQRVGVIRRWIGRPGSHSHFGNGWADDNIVRLQLIDPETVIVSRGGAGWFVAHKREQSFKTSSETEITRSAEGWQLRSKAGVSMLFDPDGRLTSRSVGGQKFTCSYDKATRLTTVSSGEKNSLRYSYDSSGRVVQVDGPEGLRATYSYDAAGRLAEVVSDTGVKTTYRYDDSGALLAARDQFGAEIKIPELARFRPAAATLAQAATTPQPSYKTDAFGRITEMAMPDGGAARIEYNKLGLPTSISSPGRGAERLVYDQHGLLVRREASPQNWEEYRYDTNGRVAVIVRPGGAEERIEYDEQDQITRIKTADGPEVVYDYDPRGNLIGESWSSGEKITRVYNAKGQLAEITSASGLRTQFSYDDRGNVTQSSDPVHGWTRYSETAAGHVIEREGAGKTTVRFTPDGAPVSVITAAGQRTLFQLDPSGRPVATLPADGIAARYKYDAAGQLTNISAPGGGEIALKRDRGRLAEIIRGDIVWRQFRHDDEGRVAEIFSPLGRGAKYTYDKEGRLATVMEPGGEIAVAESADGRRRTLKGAGYEIEEEFSADGILVRRNNKTAALDLKFPRDDRGRIAGVELNGAAATYGYDARGHVERIDLPGQKTIQLTRDDAGRVTRVALHSAAVMNVGYDRADRVTAIDAANSSRGIVWKESYAFDPAGNLAEIKRADATFRLEYDQVDRLTKISGGKAAQGFRYDLGGNLSFASGVRWVLDKIGRPSQQGATSFTWDAAGNLVRAENALTRAENTFDAAGRLAQRTREKSVSKFGYLPSGDRLWRESEKGRAWFTYTNEALAAYKDESGTSWMVVNLPGTDWPVAFCGSNGATYFVLADRLHSTRRIIDDSGNVIASADFGAFGKLEQENGAAPLKSYAGMVVDGADLYYARQRYYDPALARFISIDPLPGTLSNPATHNAYSYALNNPHRYRDPMGTAPLWAEWLHHEHWDFAKWTTQELQLFLQHGGSEAPMEHLLAHLEKRGVHYVTPATPPVRPPGSPRPGIRVGPNSAGVGGGANNPTVAGQATQTGGSRNAQTVAAEAAETAANRNAATIATEAGGTAGNRATTTIAGEAAESAATRAAPTVAVEAVETGSRLSRLLGAGGRLLGLLGKAAPVIDLLYTANRNLEAAQMIGAVGEEAEARRLAQAMKNALENKLASLAATDPSKIIPMPMPDGKPFNPNNPEHIEQLMIGMHSNLTNNKKPFEGILVTEPDPQQQRQLEDALASARELLRNGEAAEEDVEDAIEEIGASDEEAQAQLKLALFETAASTELSAGLSNLPVAADDVKKRTASVDKQADNLRAAEAEMKAAVAISDNAATRACDFAGQASGATEQQLGKWRNEANDLLFKASNQLNAAQEKIEQNRLATEELRTALAVLSGYRSQLEFLQLGSSAASAVGLKVKTSVDAARAAADKSTRNRTSITRSLGEIRTIPERVRAILAPVSWSPAVLPLLARADALGTELAVPPSFDFASALNLAMPGIDAFLSSVARVEEMIRTVDIDGLTTQANNAIYEADAAFTSAHAIAGNPDRYRALQQASKCIAQLTAASPKVAAASPAPSPSPSAVAASDDVTVPDLSGASTSEMESMLAHAGLKRSLVAAKDKPPTKEKEFKFASQSPGAGTKVKRGSTVAVAMYPKFEEASAAASDEVTVPDLSGFTSTSEMEAVLTQAGLKRSLVAAKEKPPSKEKEFKFAGQTPAAGTQVKRGSTVAVSVYQKFEDALASDETNVPDLSAYTTTSEMKAALTHAGLSASLVSAKDKPPSKEKEFKLASQSPAPDTKVKKGSTVMLAFYQKYEGSDTAQTSGGVPSLIGLTLEQARDKLTAAGLQLAGTEVGSAKPPKADDAYRIYAQEPAAGQSPPTNKFVTVKQYGGASSGSTASSSAGAGGGSGNSQFTGVWEAVEVDGTGRRTEITISESGGTHSIKFNGDGGWFTALGASGGTSSVENNKLIFSNTSTMSGAQAKWAMEFTRAGDRLSMRTCADEPRTGKRDCGGEPALYRLKGSVAAGAEPLAGLWEGTYERKSFTAIEGQTKYFNESTEPNQRTRVLVAYRNGIAVPGVYPFSDRSGIAPGAQVTSTATSISGTHQTRDQYEEATSTLSLQLSGDTLVGHVTTITKQGTQTKTVRDEFVLRRAKQ